LLWALILACVLACLGSCTNLPIATEDAKAPDVFDRIRALDLLPRQPLPVDQNAQIGGNRGKPVLYTGVVVPATQSGRAGASDSYACAGLGTPCRGPDGAGGGEGYELNFENTPIAMVAKAVLGDILGLGYAVDPRVQGTISLSSGKAVPKSDLLFVLESVLRMNNIVLVRDGSTTYRLIPLGDATGGGNTDSVAGHTEPGYGVSVITLRYVSAAALIKLLDSFAIRPGQVRADPARNMLLIQGTGPERRNTMETALSFDVDWMRGQSVGIFPVQYSSPEPIIAELDKILDAGDGGLSQGNIKFQVMARMNRGAKPGQAPAFRFKSVPQGSATSVWAGFVASADAVGGHYCEDCHVCEINDDVTSRVGVRSYALNLAHANDLWRKSEEMVGERFPL